jgi:hypothetical protein
VEGFFDIHQMSLNKVGEELCGDQTRVIKTPTATTLILSDGLGSGVKANILATLTVEILATMLQAEINLHEILDTVIRTLPVDAQHRIAYATFTILTLKHADGAFRVLNFDNPAPFWIKDGHIEKLAMFEEKILGRTIATATGILGMGDFLGLVSDGVLHAGPGTELNQAWGWDQIAAHLETQFTRRVFAAHSVINGVMAVTNRLYAYRPSDDATFLGVLRRRRAALLVFTGPPLDTGFDYVPVERFIAFEGRKVICGGTTANIVANFLKTKVETDSRSLSDAYPPTGKLPGVELVTEGVITLAAVIDALESSGGALERLEPAHSGVYLLARELLLADAITFFVGQAINPAYYNPLLPKNTSIRRYLVERLTELLTGFHKDVTIEYF